MAGKKLRGIYPHGNGWKIQVKDPQTGRWKQVTATRQRFEALGVPLKSALRITKADAGRLKQKYEDLLHQAAVLGVPSVDIALDQAIKEYLKYQRNAPEFLRTKQNVLGEFRSVVGNICLRDVTKTELQAFESHLRGSSRPGKPLHATSVARYLRYVRTFFNYCGREGWIGRSPFVNFQLPRDESVPIETYSLDELQDLVGWLRTHGDREYVVWVIVGFVGLGLRSMELQGLDWKSFDSKERFVFIEHTKNPESKRMQPVPKSLMPLFKHQKQKTGPMFPTLSGNASSRNQMSVLGRRIASHRPGFTWRRLRRTYATLLQSAGVDSLIIDRLLGHSSKSSAIRVSARHYIGKEYAFYRSLVDEALKPLGRILTG